jgi:hypothetical protein
MRPRSPPVPGDARSVARWPDEKNGAGWPHGAGVTVDWGSVGLMNEPSEGVKRNQDVFILMSMNVFRMHMDRPYQVYHTVLGHSLYVNKVI